MARIPGFCPHCRNSFVAENFISGSGATHIHLIGMTTTCLHCGAEANIVDGTFNLMDDELELVNGPPLTKALMDGLRRVIDEARQKSINAEEILTEISGVSPELAQKIRQRGLPYFAIILFLLWLLKSVELSLTLDLNKLFDQVQAVSQMDDSERILDNPLPIETAAPKPLGQSTLAATQEGQPSRQVRRQLERQARKRTKFA